jgi:hypothetical protein
MAKLLVKFIGDTPVEYRFIAEPWEEMAFFMDDLRGYPTEEEALAAHNRAQAQRAEEGGHT